MGVISAIGNSVQENRAALILGKCGISPLQLIDSKFTGQLPCGEIKTTTEVLKQTLEANDKGITRTTLLALHAFNEAIENAQLSSNDLSSPGTAFINASTVGGMCLTEELYQDAQKIEGGSEYLSSYECSS